MLWVYDHYKYLISFSAGSLDVYRRQIIKPYDALKHQYASPKNDLFHYNLGV